MTQPRIQSVEARAPATLIVVWSTGDVTPIDLSDALALRAYAALADPEVFTQVAVVRWGHAVEWPGGADMGADMLWHDARRQHPAGGPVAESRQRDDRLGSSQQTAS